MKRNIFHPILAILIVCVVSLYSMGSFWGTNVETAEDVLSFGDTTASFGLVAGAKGISITVVDSAMTGTDSVRIYSKSGSRPYYSLLSVHEYSQTTTTTNVNLIIPGNGVTSTYLVPDEYLVTDLYVVRVNATPNYSPVTRIVVRSIK